VRARMASLLSNVWANRDLRMDPRLIPPRELADGRFTRADVPRAS